MKQWIREHDDRWSFILPYVLLSVVLSVALSLFWLVVLMVLHGILEWQRHEGLPGGRRVLHIMARLQLDIALLTAAVCMEVYFEFAAGLAGAGQFTRGVARLLARFPSWQHVLRALLLSSDDALQLVRFKRGTLAGETAAPPRIERLPATLLALSALLLLAAVPLTSLTPGDFLSIIAQSFRPLP